MTAEPLPDWASSDPAEYAIALAQRRTAEAPEVEPLGWDPGWGADPRDDPAYAPVSPAQEVRIAKVVAAAIRDGIDPSPDAPKRPDLQSVASIPEPVDTDTWLIEGIARPSALVVLGAAEGVGKSQARTELAIRAVTGTGSLFGHYAIPHPLRVAVIDEENGHPEEYRRESAVLAALGLGRDALGGYYRASFAGMVLTDRDAQTWLEEQVAAVKPDLLVLDTGTSMVGDEWGSELKAAVRFIRGLIARHGCSVLVVVHLTKPPRDRKPGAVHGTAIADVMGQWTRSADAVALMADLGDGRSRFEMRKKVPPSTLILARRDGIFETVALGDAPRKVSTEDRVLRAVAAGAESIEGLMAGLGLGRSTVMAGIASLRSGGFVAAGTPYLLTDAGLEAVQ